MTEPAAGPRLSVARPSVSRALVALVQVLGLAVWFSATAVGPALRTEWDLGSTAAVWLTCAVQLGFVAGAVSSAVFTLADRVRPHRLLALSAVGAAVCTLLCTVADGAATAILLRGLTGMFLAGVYPVGMKLMTSWSRPERRARDLGTLVGALTLGSALPHLVLAGGTDLAWRDVLAVASGTGLLAAAVAALFVRPGPGTAPAPPPDRHYAVRMLRDRAPRLVVLGYLGHMWELYALWTWLGSYLGAGALAFRAELLVFLTVGLGGLIGCLAGGRSADRWGRAPTVVTALTISGLCCLLSPFAVAAPPVVTGLFCLVWATAAVADSPVLTTATIEVTDSRYTGTALTVQTALGFALTVVSIELVPVVAGVTGWSAALAVLAPGPMIGAVAMVRLGRVAAPAAPAPARSTAPPAPAATAPAAPAAMAPAPAAAFTAPVSAAPGLAAAPVAPPAPRPAERELLSSNASVREQLSSGRGGAGKRRGSSPEPVARPRPAIRARGEDDTVELYRLRRTGPVPADGGFAADAARALQREHREVVTPPAVRRSGGP